jgi:hypothetical protein
MSFSSPEDTCGIAIHFSEKRFEAPGSRQILARPPLPIPVAPVERPKAGDRSVPKLGNRGSPPYRRIVETRPDFEQRDGVAADRVAEPSPVLDVREHAAIVETIQQSLNEAPFELGQHGWVSSFNGARSGGQH